MGGKKKKVGDELDSQDKRQVLRKLYATITKMTVQRKVMKRNRCNESEHEREHLGNSPSKGAKEGGTVSRPDAFSASAFSSTATRPSSHKVTSVAASIYPF